MNSMRFTVLSCMNNNERLWVSSSDGEVFKIGYNTMMKLADEKLLDKARTIPYRVEVKSGIIRRFYPPRRGIIIQFIQHPFDGGLTVCGFAARERRWYVWVLIHSR